MLAPELLFKIVFPILTPPPVEMPPTTVAELPLMVLLLISAPAPVAMPPP